MPLAVCATPIGNLEDVTLRVLRELGEAGSSSARTRAGREVLLARHAVAARSCAATTGTTRRHGPRSSCPGSRRVSGSRLSPTGLPGVNDPGARLIAAALETGVPVTVLPGRPRSRPRSSRAGSGRRYQFLGYLPRGEAALAALWAEQRLAASGGRVRSPERLAALRSLAGVAPAAGRGLPRADEAVRGGRARAAAAVADRLAAPPKGEITLVVGASVAGVDEVGEAAARGRGRAPRRRRAEEAGRRGRGAARAHFP